MRGSRAEAVDRAMERYAAGDDSAFGEVYDGVAVRVYVLAIEALGDAALAEDVVQHTFLNMHRARGAFVAGAEVLPWAYTIARRLVVDVMRRRWRERRMERAGAAQPKSDPAEPDEELAAKQTAASLSLALDALPESQRKVLELRDRGMTVEEMAHALGTTVTAVKLRLHRATTSLRAAVPGSRD